MGFGGVKRWGLILLLLVQCFVWPVLAAETVQGPVDAVIFAPGDLTEQSIECKVPELTDDVYVFEKCTFKGLMFLSDVTFNKQVFFYNCTFEDDVYFNGATFSQLVSFAGSVFKRLVNFSGCAFEGQANFADCQFNGSADFTNCQFKSSGVFTKCQFRGRVSFGEHSENERTNFEKGKQEERQASKFFGNVFFNRSVFETEADFPLVVFKSNADFRESTFKGRADFNKAIFKSKVEFDRATFFGEADFERSIFLVGASGGGVNFYKADFQGDLSFSKSVFQSDVSFKKARFRGRLFLSNCLFLQKADFERASFDGEVYAAGLNEPSEHFQEMFVYRIGEAFDLPEPFEGNPAAPDKFFEEVTVWKNSIRNSDRENKFRKTFGDWISMLPDSRLRVRPWAGKLIYPGEETYKALSQAILGPRNSRLILSGARFRKSVDFRGAILRDADLSSNEMITVFQGPVEMADATIIGIFNLSDTVFQMPVDLSGIRFPDKNNPLFNSTRVDLRGAEFQAKLNLPLAALFSLDGLVSQQLAFLNAFSTPPEFEDTPGDGPNFHYYPDFEVGDKEQIVILYQQLERLFRKNVQLTEANEMAVRAAWLNLNLRDDIPSSLVTLIAVPIKNVLFLMVAVNLLFYLCMLKRKAIFGRKEERTFKPSKIPFVYMPDIDHTEQRAIVPCNTLWRRLVWPLFLCLGTFFALFSLGSEYVTRDERCLDNMKTLRVAGFVLIPLLIYALAKRSEGLHHIFTLMG